MARRSAERLKSYLELISRKQGLESVLEATSPQSDVAFELAESPMAREARSGLESVLRGRDPTPEEEASLEALIIPDLRPAIDIVDGKFNSTHRLWTHLTSDAAVRGRIEAAIPSVGRIELPGNPQYPYGGTGFVRWRRSPDDQSTRRRDFRHRPRRSQSRIQGWAQSRNRLPAGTRRDRGDNPLGAAGGDDPPLLGHGNPRGRRTAPRSQAAQTVCRQRLRSRRPRDSRDRLSGFRSAQRCDRTGQSVRSDIRREAAATGSTPRPGQHRKFRQDRVGRGPRLFHARRKLRFRGGGSRHWGSRGAAFRRPVSGEELCRTNLRARAR